MFDKKEVPLDSFVLTWPAVSSSNVVFFLLYFRMFYIQNFDFKPFMFYPDSHLTKQHSAIWICLNVDADALWSARFCFMLS